MLPYELSRASHDKDYRSSGLSQSDIETDAVLSIINPTHTGKVWSPDHPKGSLLFQRPGIHTERRTHAYWAPNQFGARVFNPLR